MSSFGKRFARGLKRLNTGGQAVTLVRRSSTGTLTPSNPNGTQDTKPTTVKATVLGYRQNEIDGTEVQGGDRKILITPADISNTPPDTSDEITIGTKTFKVVSVKSIEPHGVDALYVVQAR